MAKVLLERIGSPIEKVMDLNEYKINLEKMQQLNETYKSKREEIKAGWGETYIERVHKKGKMTTWERIEFLKDTGSKVFPIGTFVNYGLDLDFDRYCSDFDRNNWCYNSRNTRTCC